MQDNRQQTIEFKYTGLDQDSDQRLMNPGDSRYRLNCINDSTNDGMLGDIQNLAGNLAYLHTSPSGTNITIGSCKDTQNNAIIYFVYNSLGNHQIRRFYPDSGTDEVILGGANDPLTGCALLNFQPTYRIYNANIIQSGEEGQLLYWTDGYFDSYLYNGSNILRFNPPRKINILKAYNYTNGLPDGYTAITFETLDRIKHQPTTPAELRYIYDAAMVENYLYGKMYQFTYRYIYDDKEVSTWSTLSKVLMPIYNYQYGSPLQLLENTIGVTLNSGSEIVTEIEIAIRSSVTNVDGGNSYFIVSRLNKSELGIPNNTSYEYSYNGVAFKENLLAEDYLRPFDYVPQVSYSQEIAGGRLVDGNIVENYDSTDIELEAEYIRYAKINNVRDTSPDFTITSDPNTNAWGTNNDMQYPIPTFKQLGLYQVGVVYYDRASRSSVVNTKEEYLFPVPSIDEGIVDPFAGILGDPLKLRLSINNTPPDWATHWAPVLTKELSYTKKQQILITENQFNYQNGKLQIPPTAGYTFAEGDRIRLISTSISPVSYIVTSFGSTPATFITYDEIETYTEYEANDFLFPPSSYNNNLITQSSSTFNYQIQEYDSATLEITLSDEDTIDIRNYFNCPGTGPYNIIKENRFFVVEIYNKNRDTTENKIFYEIGDKLEIGNPNTASRYHKAPEQDQIIGSQPAIIDIFGFDCFLRRKKNTMNVFPIIMDGSTSTVLSGGLSVFYPEIFIPYFKNADLTNVSIIEWDGVSFGFFGCAVTTGLGYDSPVLTYDVFVYNTRLTQNLGSYTPDPANPVFYGLMYDGDIDFYIWVETDEYSGDYPSTVYNDGRVNSNLETLGRKNYISRIRWSGKLYENTLTNELSTVFEGSYTDLSETYNQITRLRQVGDTLRVRQKNKMSSFYIDKNMLNVNEGVASVGQSSDFLSSPNLYDEYYGSYSPGSDSISTRTTYFLDLLHGIVVRDAGNKPIPISGDEDNATDQFKMAKFFRDLCKNIRVVGEDSFNIISCWDEFSSLYTLTVQDLRTVYNEVPNQSMTIVFHEPTNRWKSFMSYIPEWYETIGKYVISFRNGQPYLHYSNPLQNNFFGAQYGQELRVTCNIGRNTVKIFNNLDVYSNIAWEIPTVNIPSSPNAPNGMLSAIPAARFKAKEGIWHAAFLRDKNDPKYTSTPIALINGRRLRGETIELVMTNTSTNLVYLRALNIYINPSELTL